MKTKLFLGFQILTGLILVLFGLNIFLQFLPKPPSNDVMSAFTFAVYKVGYIYPLMGAFLVITGLSFILNKYTALMSVLVIPFILNAFLAHAFLDINGIAPSAFLLIAVISLMYKNKEAYILMFKA